MGGERHCESKVSYPQCPRPGRARIRAARSGVERTNHEATAPFIFDQITMAQEQKSLLSFV